MPRTPEERLTSLLEQNKVVPVIGAGVSSAVAQLPGWKQALQHGFTFAQQRRLSEEDISVGRALLEEGRLTESADALKRLLNSPSHPFSTWLNELFGAPEVRDLTLLTNIHKLCCPIILTTNYDDLIFKTLIGGQKLVFDWMEFQEVQQAIHGENEFILHLHGRINKPETIILSAADYEHLSSQLGYKHVLQMLWMNYHFLFIGCSSNGVLDDDFITVINFLRKWFPSNPHSHFMLMNERSVEEGEHLKLLFDCNIEPISYGRDYAYLPKMIDLINPNANRLAEKIMKLFKTHFHPIQPADVDIEDLLLSSRQFKTLKEKLDRLKREFESKKIQRFYFDSKLYAEIQKMEALISEFKAQVIDLVTRFPETKQMFAENGMEDVNDSLTAQKLEARALRLKLEQEELRVREEEIRKEKKQLAQDFLLKASLVFMNVENLDRGEVARSLIDKAVEIFADVDTLDSAARFYMIKLRLAPEGVKLYERVLLLEMDTIERIVSLYMLGTMYLAVDRDKANKHLSKFCCMAANLMVNHPYLQTLYANGVHNYASSVSEKALQLKIFEEALSIRRLAAKADPIYLSSLAFTISQVCERIQTTDLVRFESLFYEGVDALETFLRLPHNESVDFFERACLANLIVLSLVFGRNGMMDRFNQLRIRFRELLKHFDEYIVSFQPEHCVGAAHAYHEYFLTFYRGASFKEDEFGSMIDRSILHSKNSMQLSLPDDKIYYMLSCSLHLKFLYLMAVKNEHLEAIFILKEALVCCKQIKNPNDKAQFLLSILTKLDNTRCDCDDCRRARDAWSELGFE